MKSLRQQPTVLKETRMQRPDLDTLACVHAECQLCRHAGANNLVIRKVYGHDRLRLLRCRSCGEEFSERRGTALFNTKLSEASAEDVINHLGEGWSVRATARLVKVAKETVARLLRVPGRHAERFHNQHVYGLTPRALEFDEQWSFVKKSHIPSD
jgi:transposase-like protein